MRIMIKKEQGSRVADFTRSAVRPFGTLVRPRPSTPVLTAQPVFSETKFFRASREANVFALHANITFNILSDYLFGSIMFSIC